MAELPKYARWEHERRFLVPPGPLPEALTSALAPARQLEDRYLDGGRLRLRRVTGPAAEVIYKLGKKWPEVEPGSQPIVNVYLEQAEWLALSGLPGRDLAKSRQGLSWQGTSGLIDRFQGPLAGLVICELNYDDRAQLAAGSRPPWTGPELTADDRWSGAALAQLSRARLVELLSELGLALPQP